MAAMNEVMSKVECCRSGGLASNWLDTHGKDKDRMSCTIASQECRIEKEEGYPPGQLLPGQECRRSGAPGDANNVPRR